MLHLMLSSIFRVMRKLSNRWSKRKQGKSYAPEEAVPLDPRFWNSRASHLILRAGFLVHSGVTRTSQTNGKAAYIESLSIMEWAFLNIFVLFLVDIVHPASYQISPMILPYEIRKCSRVGRFIVEVSVFGCLRAVRDYLQLRNSPLRIWLDAEIADWARTFESGHLRHCGGVLCEKPEDHSPYLALSSELARDMRSMFGPILHLGMHELDSDDKFVFCDVLTILGVLPSAAEDEMTILEVLNSSLKASFHNAQSICGQRIGRFMWLLMPRRQKVGWVDHVEKSCQCRIALCYRSGKSMLSPVRDFLTIHDTNSANVTIFEDLPGQNPSNRPILPYSGAANNNFDQSRIK